MKKILALFLCFAVISSACFAKKQKEQKEQKVAKEKTVKEKPVKEKAVKEKAPKEKPAKEKPAKEKKSASNESRKQEKEKTRKERPSKSESEKLADESNAEEPAAIAASEEKPRSDKTVIAKNGKNVSVEKEIVRLQTFAENGSVGFYISGKGGVWHPVVETNDQGESTYISLFVDRKEYRLNRSKKVDYHYEVEGDCVSVIYDIKSLAQLKAEYRIWNSSVLVSYSLSNLDSKPHSFAIKAVYNTILAETYNAHFSVPSQEVSAEISFEPSSKLDYVSSGDENRAIRFVVFGEGITPPKIVVLANKDIVEESNLATVFKNGRPFNSLLSYNNSSVALFWEDENLGKDKNVLRHRIDFSSVIHEARKIEDFPPYVPPEIEEPYPDEVEIVPPLEPPAPTSEEIPADDDDGQVFDYEFNTERNYIDPSTVDENYVQCLVDRINSLEASDPALNREEIRRLQEEIDAVLEVLRSRR